MPKKLILTILLVSIALAGTFFYYLHYQNNEFERVTGINPDTIVSQFVDDREEYYGTPLPEDLRKIKEFVAEKFEYNYSGIFLRAVTPGNVLVTRQGPTGGSDCLVNLEKIVINEDLCKFVGNVSFKISNTLIYVDNQKIYYYKLGQDMFEVLPSSVLTGSEGYYDATEVAPVIEQTHTDEKLIISVFDQSQEISDYKFRKVRELTFTIK